MTPPDASTAERILDAWRPGAANTSAIDLLRDALHSARMREWLPVYFDVAFERFRRGVAVELEVAGVQHVLQGQMLALEYVSSKPAWASVLMHLLQQRTALPVQARMGWARRFVRDALTADGLMGTTGVGDLMVGLADALAALRAGDMRVLVMDDEGVTAL